MDSPCAAALEPGAALYMAIADRIRAQRKCAGMSQQVLADVVGLSRASIVNIERCRQRPSIDLLYDIADALGVQAVELLPRNEDV